jgi:hypothetical protein
VLRGRCRPVATIWGAQGLRVRLKHGLYAPRTNRPLCRGRRSRLSSTSPPFHPLRVGEAGGGLNRKPNHETAPPAPLSSRAQRSELEVPVRAGVEIATAPAAPRDDKGFHPRRVGASRWGANERRALRHRAAVAPRLQRPLAPAEPPPGPRSAAGPPRSAPTPPASTPSGRTHRAPVRPRDARSASRHLVEHRYRTH